MSFQEKLRELRQRNGLSQKKLADAIGVAQSSINYWEKGQRTPSTEVAQKLADYFQISVDELLDYEYQGKIYMPDGSVKDFYSPKSNDMHTLAAHFDRDEYTEEELEEIRQFAEFVRSKRTPKKEPLMTKVRKDTE